MDAHMHPRPEIHAEFPRETTGLPTAVPPSDVVVDDGDVLTLRIGPVRNRIGGTEMRMLAYNGSIPGPCLRVRQGSTITVDVTNHADLEQTVHWHGLRLENRFDGVPHQTQRPIPVGGNFRYELQFPDEGLYWYHPHVREDYGQEMGLYAPIVVKPADPAYWPPCHRDLVLTLDDLLLEDGRMPVFQRAGANRTMMGRYGNVLLVSGRVRPTFAAGRGEVVRLYLVNTANTRIFNVAVDGAAMKLVGGDSGRVEHERFVDAVMIAPSERAVVDVLFDRPGPVDLVHRTPAGVQTLATFTVSDDVATPPLAESFTELRHAPELRRERERLAADRDRGPDHTLQLVGEMDMGQGMGHGMSTMGHGMSTMGRTGATQHHMAAMDHDTHTTGHHTAPMQHDTAGADREEVGEADGIEWEDTMPEMNVMSDHTNMVWKLVDADTGAVNHDIWWTFHVGDRVKLRLDNSLPSDHQMHHPFHVHGAGRFLVLDRGGVEEDNLVWKDTVLVREGEVVNILLDVSNPGVWMAHCHIAEHVETGMMFSLEVLPERALR
ncbi:MAG TPA: multicopper oxidase family protein [Nitriliruptorales bacterium]|nr:multicopper oxidase family protein [Nitriliruptorales bacterium]